MSEDGNPNDHDLLIRIDERVNKVDKCMSNHLAQHRSERRVLLAAAIGAVLTGIAAIVVALILAGLGG